MLQLQLSSHQRILEYLKLSIERVPFLYLFRNEIEMIIDYSQRNSYSVFDKKTVPKTLLMTGIIDIGR